MRIENTQLDDVDAVLEIYREATQYQRRNGYNLWPEFPRDVVRAEIEERRHWKVVAGDEIVAVFVTTDDDPYVWGSRDDGQALYLHRAAVPAHYKGQKLMVRIIDWAVSRARDLQRRYVRCDTWADNPTLVTYYRRCGFREVDLVAITEAAAKHLLEHYQGISVRLFEIEVPSSNKTAKERPCVDR